MAAIGWLLSAAGTVGVVGVQWAETGAPLETLPVDVGWRRRPSRAWARSRSSASSLAGAGDRHAGSPGRAAGSSSASPRASRSSSTSAPATRRPAPAGSARSPSSPSTASRAAAWVGGLAGLLVAPPDDARRRAPGRRRAGSRTGPRIALVGGRADRRRPGDRGDRDGRGAAQHGLRPGRAREVRVPRRRSPGSAPSTASSTCVIAGARPRRPAALRQRRAGPRGRRARACRRSSSTSARRPRPVRRRPPPRPIVALGSDFGTSVKLRLIGAPGPAGENDIDVTVVDFDTGEPVDATGGRAPLRARLAARASSRRPSSSSGPGRAASALTPRTCRSTASTGSRRPSRSRAAPSTSRCSSRRPCPSSPSMSSSRRTSRRSTPSGSVSTARRRSISTRAAPARTSSTSRSSTPPGRPRSRSRR